MRRSRVKRTRLELGLLLPDVSDAADGCVDRLVSTLDGSHGIDDVHVVVGSVRGPAKLCLHYDPSRIDLARLRELVASTSAELTGRYAHLHWEVEGLGNERRALAVAERLQALDGVLEAGASSSGDLRVELDRLVTDEATVRDLLQDLDVEIPASTPQHTGDHEHRHGGIFGEHTELVFSLLAAAALALGLAFDWGTDLPDGVAIACYLVSYAFGGWFALRDAATSLRSGRFEIDALMLVAALGAAALGEFAEGAFLLVLFSLGHALEAYAMGRARRAVEALAEVTPDTARLRRGGVEIELPIGDIAVGEVVMVRAGERIPVDGVVMEGVSPVDQSPLTGESLPVDKWPDSQVFAGTVNLGSVLEVRVLREAGNSTLDHVVELVAEAQTRASPTQLLTRRFERIFVPAVLVVVVVLLLAPLALEESFADSFYRAMAVLVAASPCALAIATPSAVLSAMARAGRNGILIKGGAPLEALAGVEAVAFDKTGTLTEGSPGVIDVIAVSGVVEAELASTAVAVEALSDHPLAGAIVAGLDGGEAPSQATDVQTLAGQGVAARLAGDEVLAGNRVLFDSRGIDIPQALDGEVRTLEQQGKSIVIVWRAGRFLGVIALADEPRDMAGPTIEELRGLGIKRMVLLSGDHQAAVSSVAAAVGLDEGIGDLLPEQKVAMVTAIRDEQAGPVAMVGDGINDAPALAHADVGIAMGAAGSDVALETADVALMADDVSRLPDAIRLSRRARSIIRQNLVASLGIVALLLPATAFGLFGIGPAVLLHEGSTLIVVANALRLLR